MPIATSRQIERGTENKRDPQLFSQGSPNQKMDEITSLVLAPSEVDTANFYVVDSIAYGL